ncbi:MAG TPA: PhoH family protein [Ignavibacteria bacterium]|jgi:phosphate starvation-inducible protein PhoH and related proteins|nr:PhoH family protein [Ignavibacteria bacterium]
MNVTDKIISLEGIDLLNFSGINDQNLNLIKDYFDSTIVLRGDAVFLKGEAEELKIIDKVFNELIFLQKRQGEISQKDVKLVLSLIYSKDDQVRSLKQKFGFSPNELNDVILSRKNDFIKPRTPNQSEYFKKVKENDIVFAIGPAGTGKTYLAVAFAVAALRNKEINKIVLTRPAVEAGESLGFLPGNLSEKVDPYLRPLYDALEDMVPLEKLAGYMEKNIIEVIPLAYMRGRTLNNAFVILDEAQNSTTMQMKMFLTRLGPNSKAIVTGDVTQIDLPKRDQSGLVQIQEILKNVDDITFLYFEKSDVVRHKLVKDIINAYEKFQGQ